MAFRRLIGSGRYCLPVSPLGKAIVILLAAIRLDDQALNSLGWVHKDGVHKKRGPCLLETTARRVPVIKHIGDTQIAVVVPFYMCLGIDKGWPFVLVGAGDLFMLAGASPRIHLMCRWRG